MMHNHIDTEFNRIYKAIRQGGLPFEVKLDIPNEITAAAIREGRQVMKDKNVNGYKNMDDLRTALEE